MHYTPNFCGCHFLPKLPLGHLSNSKIHGGLWCKRCNVHARKQNGNEGRLKSNMGQLPIYLSTRAQNLESFERDILFRQPWLAWRNNSKVWHHFMKIIGRIRTLMWCLGSSGLSFGPLLIGFNFSWYISSLSIATEMLEITYLDCTIMWSLSRLMQCSLSLVFKQQQ